MLFVPSFCFLFPPVEFLCSFVGQCCCGTDGFPGLLFNTKSLGLRISSVSCGSLSFLMCHCSTSDLRNFVDFNLGNWLSVAVLHPISFPSFLFKNDDFIGFKMIYNGSFNLG